MTYPSPPEISTSYSAAEQALGNGTLPGQEIDVDFAAVRASVTEAIEFLKGITRSDGKLANGIVTTESLASSVIAGFDTPVVWATGQNYTTSSLVFEGVALYICLVAHTSTVFATDLASSRWSLLADLTPPGGGLVASNNLSDLTDTSNARANLGLGSMSTAASGTGAAQHRTNIENDAVYQAILTGLTASVAELNFTDGVTSPIQTQLNGKQATLTGLTASVAELNFTDGVTSPIQTQLDGKAAAGAVFLPAVGDIGSYALLTFAANTTASAGSTHAGSGLRYSNVVANLTGAGTPSGTWRLMGNTNNAGPTSSTSLFLRIS